jgi:hypothetical protein
MSVAQKFGGKKANRSQITNILQSESDETKSGRAGFSNNRRRMLALLL